MGQRKEVCMILLRIIIKIFRKFECNNIAVVDDVDVVRNLIFFNSKNEEVILMAVRIRWGLDTKSTKEVFCQGRQGLLRVSWLRWQTWYAGDEKNFTKGIRSRPLVNSKSSS